MPLDSYTLYIGIDWADKKHDLFLRWADGSTSREQIESKPQDVLAFFDQISTRLGPNDRVVLFLEQSRGALFSLLSTFGWIDLIPINPEALANYRKCLFSSRSKNDPTDAQLIEDFGRLHLGRLRVFKPASQLERGLDAFCRQRRHIVDSATGFSNELRSLLKSYFPVANELFENHNNLRSPIVLDFLSRWPSLEALQKARLGVLRSFFFKHNSRSGSLMEERLGKIKNARPVSTDPALIQPALSLLGYLLAQLRCATVAIDRLEKNIASIFESHPDHQLFKSLPGAGAQLAPRLLCALGSDRSRYRSAGEIQAFFGIAPITIQSGKSRSVHFRLFRPTFLCQTLMEFAANSIPRCQWANAFYKSQIQNAKHHFTAVRALAFKWIRVLFACWKNHQPYDDSRYLGALKTRNSPLTLFIPSST